MMTHECEQKETIGRIKEFMKNMDGFKASICTIAFAIVIQVVTFAFLWGSLTQIVSKNDEHLWKKLTPDTAENTRNIDKILAKFEFMGEAKEQGFNRGQ